MMPIAQALIWLNLYNISLLLLELCSPIYSTSTTTVKCVDKRGSEINCLEATENSVLTYTCAPFYEIPFGFRKTIVCLHGSWNHPKPVCQPGTEKIPIKTISNDCCSSRNNLEASHVSHINWKSLFLFNYAEWISVCGRKVNDDAIPLIYGGKVQKGLEYPWVMALYRKNGDKPANICGGSLISQKVVLTGQ